MCQICFKEKPDCQCAGTCEKFLHLKCLKEQLVAMDSQVAVISQSNNEPVVELSKLDDEQIRIGETCYECIHKFAECFSCKRVGNFDTELDISQSNEKVQKNVFKCSICYHFYHLKCVYHQKFQVEKNKFKCAVHYCQDCQEFSNQHYRCIECPMAFHKKCMSKRNKILKIQVISCYKHKKEVTSRVK